MVESVAIRKTSMLGGTPVYQLENGDVVPGLLRKRVYADASDDMFLVTARFANNWQGLATEFLGDPELWWVLTDINGVIDPLYGLQAGMQVRVPTKDRLQRAGIL